MKKTFKRAGVAVLSMAMLLSMGAVGAISANAAVDNNAVTITAPARNASYGTQDATYKFYKVLNANAHGDTYDYSVTTSFSTYTTVADLQAAENGTAADKQVLAETLATHIPANADYTVSSGNTVDVLPGYYLVIMDPTGTAMTAAPILLSVRSDMSDTAKTLAAKTSGVTFDKAITGGAHAISADNHKAEAAVGSEIEYTITSTIPAYSDKVQAGVLANTPTVDLTDYKIVDTPSTGITIIDGDNLATVNGVQDATARTNSIVVSSSGNALTADDYTLDTTSNAAGTGFIVTINDAYIVNNPGQTITITFKGVLNDNATQSTDATSASTNNHNSGTLTYDNSYDVGGGTDTKTQDTEVYTASFDFTKTFGGSTSTTKLAGATFTLHKGTANGDVVGTFTTTTTVTTKTFTGLAAGTYVLVEDTAPDGYAKAANQTITITADLTSTDVYTITGSGSISMNNDQGQVLPGTGGMGTIMFTVGGAAIILFAGVMFVLYMRKRRSEEE